jgi:hypothetical protein
VRYAHERSPLVEELADREVFVVDWYDRVMGGGSWQDETGNRTALKYGLRAALCALPIDDDVLVVTINDVRHLVHASEIPEAA